MNSDPTPVNTVIPPATIAAKGYRVERRYEGDRTAAQIVSALMKVHNHRETI